MRKNWKLFLYCLISVGVIIILYFSLTKTFYQQDEWFGYGLFLARGPGLILQSAGGIWGIIFGQGRIFTNLLLFLFYKYFPLNVFPIAVFAILLHAVNVLIVFYLARKLFKKTLPAFLGSLFFAVNSVSQSAIVWPAASINTLPSTTLILIAIYFFFKHLESLKQKWLGLSFLFIYVSLFFKETGIFLFLLLPIFAFFYKKQNFLSFLKTYWYFFTTTFLIVVFRIWGLKSVSGPEALFLTGSSKYFFDSIAVRSLLYPTTSFSLAIVPPVVFLNFARYITNVYYPFIPEDQFILVAQTVVLDLLAVILSAVIGFASMQLLKISDPKIRKNIIFWFIFLLSSFLPYIIISKSYSYLESRYYYLASAVWAVIFAWIADLIIRKLKLKYIKYTLLAIFILFLYVHVQTVRTDIIKLVVESQVRIGILNQIRDIKPKLEGKKNIFYVTGDTDFYLPGNKVPFQQGFGYTLLAFYFPKSGYPSAVLNNTELFEIGKEGYYETDDYGFGYFSDLESLKKVVGQNMIYKNSIVALYYSSKAEKILNITREVLPKIYK